MSTTEEPEDTRTLSVTEAQHYLGVSAPTYLKIRKAEKLNADEDGRFSITRLRTIKARRNTSKDKRHSSHYKKGRPVGKV